MVAWREDRPTSQPGLTAWQVLFVHGGLSGGQRVLIHLAGGGAGSIAVQLARAAGAHVIATGRGWCRELVTELGAERFVDLDRERFEDVAEEVDLVVDLVGGEVLQRSAAAVKDEGVVVSAVEDPRPWVDRASRARGLYLVVESARSELEAIASRLPARQGMVRPFPGREEASLRRGRGPTAGRPAARRPAGAGRRRSTGQLERRDVPRLDRTEVDAGRLAGGGSTMTQGPCRLPVLSNGLARCTRVARSPWLLG